MVFHIEQFTREGWVRVASGLTTMALAKNLQRAIAERAHLDIDNYSILVEVIDG